MNDHSEAFVAFDTAKLRNAVAIADGGRGDEVRFLGEFDNTPAATAKLVRKLAAKYERLTFCYEAADRLWLYRQTAGGNADARDYGGADQRRDHDLEGGRPISRKNRGVVHDALPDTEAFPALSCNGLEIGSLTQEPSLMPATLGPSSLQPPGLYAGLAVAKSAWVPPSGGTRALRRQLRSRA